MALAGTFLANFPLSHLNLAGGPNAYPLILAGGSGTRLWPLSRSSFPKQFTDLDGDQSLFQTTLARLSGPMFAPPMVVTGHDYRFITAEQIEQAGIKDAQIILEPLARNTAPAILAAALQYETQPQALLLVAPSDHRIGDTQAFTKAVEAAAIEAGKGRLVTLGIQPSGPETGYGYLALSKPAEQGKAQPLKSFVEKPDLGTAKALVTGGQHLWNAGIFLFSVQTLLDAFALYAPELLMACRSAVASGQNDLGFFRLDEAAYGACENISIDYAIMERAEALSVVPVDCNWSDLGSWRSVHTTQNLDSQGNSLDGLATQIDCQNTLLMGEDTTTRVVGLGLKNIAAIATRDAILVAHMDESERVKDVVAELKRIEAPEATDFKLCHRPWGHYETLALGGRFQVKRIVVKPGGQFVPTIPYAQGRTLGGG